MSELGRLKPHPGSRHRPKRVGRGPGSGHGKTSGKGHKGQLQHGRPPRPGFEGGQMPLIRTMPKRGFGRRPVARFQILNVADLAGEKPGTVLDPEYFFKNGFTKSRRIPVKVLGDGEMKAALHVRAHAFSRSAKAKIEKAGGKCEPAGPA
jgi:large subunit ribosomal protein L15